MLQMLLLIKVLFTKNIKAQLLFLWQYFFIIFMRQTLTDVCLMKTLNINIKPKTLLKLYSKIVISI